MKAAVSHGRRAHGPPEQPHDAQKNTSEPGRMRRAVPSSEGCDSGLNCIWNDTCSQKPKWGSESAESLSGETTQQNKITRETGASCANIGTAQTKESKDLGHNSDVAGPALLARHQLRDVLPVDARNDLRAKPDRKKTQKVSTTRDLNAQVRNAKGWDHSETTHLHFGEAAQTVLNVGVDELLAPRQHAKCRKQKKPKSQQRPQGDGVNLSLSCLSRMNMRTCGLICITQQREDSARLNEALGPTSQHKGKETRITAAGAESGRSDLRHDEAVDVEQLREALERQVGLRDTTIDQRRARRSSQSSRGRLLQRFGRIRCYTLSGRANR